MFSIPRLRSAFSRRLVRLTVLVRLHMENPMPEPIKTLVTILSACMLSPTLLVGQTINSTGEAVQAFNVISILTQNPDDQDALNVPSYVFTLPKPKYKMPSKIQNIIMFSIKINPIKEEILRDEYRSIYKSKNDLNKWLYQNVRSAWSFVFRQLIELTKYYAANGEPGNLMSLDHMVGESATTLTNQAYRWLDYVNSKW